MKHNKLLNIALAILFAVALFACEGEEEPYSWMPGNSLHIIGDSEVAVGDTTSFRVDGFTVDKTYNWTLNSNSLTPIRQGEYVEVPFPQLGEYTLIVSDGNLADTLTIMSVEE